MSSDRPPFSIDRSQLDALGVAAKLLAVCAYPERKHLGSDGLAHRFFKAQLAWMMRRAKAIGKVDSLPLWAPSVQQQNNSLQQGIKRLYYMRAAHLLFTDSALFSGGVGRGNTNGNDWDFVIRSNRDFSRMTFTFSNSADAIRHAIAGIPNRLQAAIRFHLPAFGRWVESDDAVRDVRKRYVYPYLAIAPVFFVVHDECCNQEPEAVQRGWPPFLMLISNPDWVERAVERAQKLEPIVIQMANQIGLSWFDETYLVRVREIPGAGNH